MSSTMIERYSRAVASSNLKSDEHHFHVDSLAAVALAGGIGNLLFRVKYADDATSYNALLEAWVAVVIKKAGLRHWPKHITPEKVANKSLMYWLNDVCDACAGRGYQQIAATPALSDMACKDCSGSGKKPLFCDTRIRNQVEEMVGTLDEMTLHAAGQAMKKLAARMEV